MESFSVSPSHLLLVTILNVSDSLKPLVDCLRESATQQLESVLAAVLYELASLEYAATFQLHDYTSFFHTAAIKQPD
jgi:hypothetical protein